MGTGDFKLEIRPEWEQLGEVRRSLVSLLRGRGLRGDEVDAVAMVACELGENAIKYGTVRGEEDRVSLAVSISGPQLTIEVFNRIGSKDEDNLVRLDRTVQWIRGYHDPFEAWLQRLKELSSQPLDNNESRLGLVRIAYEGQAVLDFYVNENDVLAVSAIHRLKGEEPK